MTAETYEDLKNNESIQLDDNLQNLIKQIDEIKDTKKDNDKIEWVFIDTTEWQAIEKALNEWLRESLYLNPDTCKILANEINRILNDSNLQFNDDIKNSLVSLLDFLKWVLGNYDAFVVTPEVNVTPENEALEDSPVSLDFLDSLSEDDLISLCDNENRSKIRKELIKEENWKKYTIIKWKRFYVESIRNTIYSRENNDNIIQIKPGAIYLWNKNCYIRFQTKYGVINIFKGRSEADVIKHSDWQSLRTYENKDGHFRASNGISIRSYTNATTTFRFYSNNNSVLSLRSAVAQDAFYEITSILSRIKDSKEQCKIVDENTLHVWDTNYKFPEGVEINEIAEWINNYYN